VKNNRNLNYTQNDKEIEQQKKEILLEISNLNKEIKKKKKKKKKKNNFHNSYYNNNIFII